MRNRIDYGIDLGTTNSAIARIEQGIPVIKKSNVQSDTTPSCVGFRRNGACIVGLQAFNQLNSDRLSASKGAEKAKNVFIEFKRTMGTDEVFRPGNSELEWSSESLSSEVLKKLKSYINDEKVHAAVITIPAAFTVKAQDATARAASLAGLDQYQLLQEPVAAVMAYGIQSNQQSGKWVVFDFGGGTFDSALVIVEDGVITVKDTEGDNFLGGHDLDMAIVDKIILPYLRSEFEIGSLLADDDKSTLLRNALKQYAETAKIQLSFQESYEILTDLGEIPVVDSNGEDIVIELEVNRDQLADAIKPVCQRAIDLTLKLLQRNGLQGSDLDELLLVGGPTLSPVLRNMLHQQVREPNVSVDPMTVVANGAALFASTIPLQDEIVKEQVDAAASETEEEILHLQINYESTTVATQEFVTIKASPDDLKKFDGCELELRREGYSTGREKLTESGAFFEVNLEEGKSNNFTVDAWDGSGDSIKVLPSNLNIIQGTKLTGAPLPNALGVEVYDTKKDRRVFTPLKGGEKGRVLPVIGVANGLKTRSVIRPGVASDEIRISVYEAGDEGQHGARIALCDHVKDLRLNGNEVPQHIPEGTPFDLTVHTETSSSRPVKVDLLFTDLDIEVELAVSESTSSEQEDSWLEREMADANRLLVKLRQDSFIEDTEIAEIESSLRELEDMSSKAGDRAAREQVVSRLRKVLIQLDQLADSGDWPQLVADLDSRYAELVRLNVAKGDAKTTQYMEVLRQKLDQVRLSKDPALAKALLEEMAQVEFQFNQLENTVGFILWCAQNFNSLKWRDEAMARQTVEVAMTALDGQPSLESISPYAARLAKLVIEEEAMAYGGNIPEL